MGNKLASNIVKNDFKLRQTFHSYKHFMNNNVPVVLVDNFYIDSLQKAITPHLLEEQIQLMYNSMDDNLRSMWQGLFLFDGGLCANKTIIPGKGLMLLKTKMVETVDNNYVICFNVGDLWDMPEK